MVYTTAVLDKLDDPTNVVKGHFKKEARHI